MAELNELIAFSLNEPLEYEVCLEIKKEEKELFILNENDDRFLGINSWIGNSSTDEQIIMVDKKGK